MSTQEYRSDELAADADPVADQQPTGVQLAGADETETAVDAFVAEGEDDAPAMVDHDPGE
jgi:hypothetical protein